MSQEGSSGAQKGAKGTGQTLLGKQAGRDNLPVLHSLTSGSGRTRTGDRNRRYDVEWQYPGYRRYSTAMAIFGTFLLARCGSEPVWLRGPKTAPKVLVIYGATSGGPNLKLMMTLKKACLPPLKV